MRKSQYLNDDGQFFFWPEISLHDFLNQIGVDLPCAPGKFSVEFEKSSDFLGVFFLGNPFDVSTSF